MKRITEKAGKAIGKPEFKTKLAWETGEMLDAMIKVDASGWGLVYDTASGLYCGSINPIRVMRLMRGEATAK